MYNLERRRISDQYCEAQLPTLLKKMYNAERVQIEPTNKLMDIYTGADYFCIIEYIPKDFKYIPFYKNKTLFKTFLISVRKSNRNYKSFVFRLNKFGFEYDKLLRGGVKYHIQFSEENNTKQVAILNLDNIRKDQYKYFNVKKYLQILRSATFWNNSEQDEQGKRIIIDFKNFSNNYLKLLYL